MKMKAKVSLLAGAIALMGVVYMPQASAAVVSATPSSVSVPGGAVFSSTPGVVGAFTDWVNFSLLDFADLSGTATSIKLKTSGIALTSFELYNGTGAGSVGSLVSTGSISTFPAGPSATGYFGLLTASGLSPAAYTLKVVGTSMSALSQYNGGITVEPVPEPEEWAMMLVGAGLVGYQVRRKQKGLRQSVAA
jgi:hypothetical protein